MTPSPLIWLDDIGPSDRDQVGGKGEGLARLHRAGLPVPSAFVVPVAAFEQHLSLLPPSSGPTAHDDLRRAILARPLDPALAEALTGASARLGDRLAVRSSAVDEDSAHASFAGQYLTQLGVGPGMALEHAVRRCWASTFSDSAEAYRQGARVAGAGMAVVVQRMVEPRCAGVLFTVNPQTGSWREMTVEAVWGQGEALVGGTVVPDFYRVRRPRRAPRPVQRVLARVRLDPVEILVRHQDRQLAAEHGELVERPVAESDWDRPKLDRRAMLRLCRLGLRAEALSGCPQDVEWAIDHDGHLMVLQARPVTAGADVRRTGPAIWTRRFVGERWTTPATPLGWSLVRDLLEWQIAYPRTSRRYLGGESPTRLHRLAPYVNVSVFRSLLFKLPGAPPPRFMLELLPPEEERTWLVRRTQAPDLRIYASLLAETLGERRWQRFRWNPLTNWRAWEDYLGRLDTSLLALETPLRDRTSALARHEVCESLARDYLKVHICSLLFANIGYQLAAAALEAAGHGEQVAVLLRPPVDNWTVRTNEALHRLGRGELTLDAFLARFGHRADSSWELFAPRWIEEPDHVANLARLVARSADRERSEGRDDATPALAELDVGTRMVVALARRYLQLREDQRFHFDRLLWAWKRTWTWLETDSGLDLRFLDRREALSALSGSMPNAEAEALIVGRRSAWLDEAHRRAAGDEPPDFLIGNQELVDPGEASSGRLQGQGISAGVATGPVRVVRTLADADRLQPGEILVTRATDPAWTPLFLTAAGLVMEIGSLLSHGAVIAREYRLPAVVNVQGATTLLADGQVVTVDGSRGLIWIRQQDDHQERTRPASRC